MEVHTHAHTPPDSHRDKRKKWTHYLWEFLMLFLAVFCGFLAENQREHMVEHQREKQYIRSLISDIKTDTVNITNWIGSFNSIQKNCDTILGNFDLLTSHFSPFLFPGKNFLSVISGFPDFIYTDRTMQQLKNSGGLRLIRNAPASDSIISYDAFVRDLLIEETSIVSYFNQLNDVTNKLLSYQKVASVLTVNPAGETGKKQINCWIKQNAEQFELLYNLIFKYRLIIRTYIYRLDKFKSQGSRLIDFLQRVYHLSEGTPLKE